VSRVLGNGAMLTKCTLNGNAATNFGGGAYSGTLADCTLAGNRAENGGGAYSASLRNCRLTGNYSFHDATSPAAWWSATPLSYIRGNTSRIPCLLMAVRAAGLTLYSTLNNCVLGSNFADGATFPTGIAGGGRGAYGCTLYNCAVTSNLAKFQGDDVFQSTPPIVL
jgi:hypothetical protein